MADVQYLCTGSCKKVVSEDEFNNGLKACDSEGCERNGQPFAMKLFCPSCEVHYDPEETHECD